MKSKKKLRQKHKTHVWICDRILFGHFENVAKYYTIHMTRRPYRYNEVSINLIINALMWIYSIIEKRKNYHQRSRNNFTTGILIVWTKTVSRRSLVIVFYEWSRFVVHDDGRDKQKEWLKKKIIKIKGILKIIIIKHHYPFTYKDDVFGAVEFEKTATVITAVTDAVVVVLKRLAATSVCIIILLYTLCVCVYYIILVCWRGETGMPSGKKSLNDDDDDVNRL